jgi:hypothetical protein
MSIGATFVVGTAKAGSHDRPADSLHNDSELLIFSLCCLQNRHDILHCDYESDHLSVRAALVFPQSCFRLLGSAV